MDGQAGIRRNDIEDSARPTGWTVQPAINAQDPRINVWIQVVSQLEAIATVSDRNDRWALSGHDWAGKGRLAFFELTFQMLFVALRTNSMTELCVGMFADVDFQLLPVIPVISNLLTVGTNRNEAF